MIALEKLQEHIRTLTAKDWDRLFSLLSEIEATKKFGEINGGEKLENGSFTFPYWSSSEIVDKVLELMHELDIVPVFDWTIWDEGKTILENQDFNYSNLDTITLCKLLTIIVRANRFNDGFFALNFENGVLPKIIKAIKQNEIKKCNITLLHIKSALFGVAVGDALGVPVEFKSRQTISKNPVTDMIGYGTYNLPAGTWSDDSSLTFCLAEALTEDFDLNVIGQNFVKWTHENYWTARGHVFDIGIATSQAISRLSNGEKPELAGGFDETDNGNGSLMRILPLFFYLLDKPINERYEITKKVSSLTHGHIRSIIACFYYLEFAIQILMAKDKFEIYKNLQIEISNHLKSLTINPTEIALFDRLLKSNIHNLDESQIESSGYVLHTLEASIWCLLTSDNYKDSVLKAVNLGNDTDTTSAVTGGLAGLIYGLDNIPEKWLQQLAKYSEIEKLAERLNDRIASHQQGVM